MSTHADRDRSEPKCHGVAPDGLSKWQNGDCPHEVPLPAYPSTMPSDEERRTICAKCGQRQGLFHKDCDGEWVEEARTVTPWRRVPHEHQWVRHQNVMSRGYRLPAYEACACGNARPVEEWA